KGGGLGVVAKDERDDASVESAELACRELVLWMILKTRITNARDLGMFCQMERQDKRALALAPYAERECAHSSDREPRLVRGQVGTIEDGAVAHRTGELRRPADRTSHDIAVAVHVFGEGVNDHR